MELAGLNSDMSLACEIKHDDKLTEEDGVYIQAALLYTSVSGQRRLRISNLSLKTCDNMGDLYRSVAHNNDLKVFKYFSLETVIWTRSSTSLPSPASAS